jgi:hypothetical protein
MADAFKALDEYFWQVEAKPDAHAPDSAHDWIFMMRVDDWAALEDAWNARPPGWRAECAYILGYGPIGPCLAHLAKAIFDADDTVAREAADSYAAQVLEAEEPVSVPGSIRRRLQEVLHRSVGEHMDQVQRLLEQFPSSE